MIVVVLFIAVIHITRPTMKIMLTTTMTPYAMEMLEAKETMGMTGIHENPVGRTELRVTYESRFLL